MTIKELKVILSKYPEKSIVLLANDEEMNEVKPLESFMEYGKEGIILVPSHDY